MKLLYIAAPYRATTTIEIQHNIHEATLMAQYYWLRGFAVICPHLNTANFDGLVSDESFLAGTSLMLRACSDIALHPKWSTSEGCITEYSLAQKLDLTIHFTIMDRVRKALTEFFPQRVPIDERRKLL